MPNFNKKMKMPEFLIFIKYLVIGFVTSEVGRSSFYLGSTFAQSISDAALWMQFIVMLSLFIIFSVYIFKRDVHVVAMRMARSFRLDLLVVFGIGIWTNVQASPWLSEAHSALKSTDPKLVLAVLLFICVVLLSSLVSQCLKNWRRESPIKHFIVDNEIKFGEDDLLRINEQAQSFAEMVLCADHPNLIFGIDAPWGAGKTSFINLVERHWESAKSKVIVCRFEPLRHAAETDLTERLIRDLSAAIQSKVFAPEIRPTISRYSRLIRGKTEISFLGFKFSLEPSQETVDDLLDDIDEVLRRIGRRVIIVIDDLDRLDAKTVNNVLFATKRTFNLSQANYILCYDTEVLVNANEDGAKAREFLEKFVTAKVSLFIDSTSIRDFLRRDWQSDRNRLSLIPSDTMVKIGTILSELAYIIDGPLAANYSSVLGDLRKVKRFVNAILLMQIERSDLGRTDFNKRDLIHLILLHLNYPGLFRQIYAEETEGRSGTFSVKYEREKSEYINDKSFGELVKAQSESAQFLLTQLFDVDTLELVNLINAGEEVLRSRACFNHGNVRNLEAYFKLIVRFVTPEPQKTFVLYQQAVEKVLQGASISSLFTSNDFQTDLWEHAHDQFWRILINKSHDFKSNTTEDAINTLIDYFPRYSVFAIEGEYEGLRHRSIYSLLRILDRAGWGRTVGSRPPNTPENIIEIAWRIFGENSYQGKGILERLVIRDRGVLGWMNLMSFRLFCSADRGGQLYNLHSALVVHQNINAETSGNVRPLALAGMRKLSQEVFALFKKTYIDTQRNFYAEVSNTPFNTFFGNSSLHIDKQSANNSQSLKASESLDQRVESERSLIKTFVIYQLSNKLPPDGSGVGCGYYDESGDRDSGGLAKLMNKYVFDFCFNPDIQVKNLFYFLDHCLSNMSNSFFSGKEEDGYLATKSGLPGGLDPKAMGQFWKKYKKVIRKFVLNNKERQVITRNYIASYKDDLEGVFTVLDELASEAAKEDDFSNPAG